VKSASGRESDSSELRYSSTQVNLASYPSGVGGLIA